MRLFASRLIAAFRLALIPCFVFAILVGCEPSGPAASSALSSAKGQVTPAKAAGRGPVEKRKAKGAGRAASGAKVNTP
jgi:hypothetical protein